MTLRSFSPYSILTPVLTIFHSCSISWPVRKENEVALQQAEMRMVRWMCNDKVKDRDPSKELRERLGIDDINIDTTAKQVAMV